jgi:hypothetical protein
VRLQVRAEHGEGRGVPSLGRKEELGGVQIHEQRDVLVPALACRLVQADRADLGEIRRRTSFADVMMEHPPDARVVLADELRDRLDRHLLDQRQHERLEEQREAAARPRPRHLDQPDPARVAANPRDARVQMCLVLKEVQMAPALLRRVVCPAPLSPALRAGEGRTPLEVEVHVQSTSLGVERRPHNAPRPSQAQGLLEELSVTHGQPWPLTPRTSSHELHEQRQVPISRCSSGGARHPRIR